MPLPRSKARRKGFRSQLEQEVLRLQEVLREETALHAILDNALDHAAVTLADMSYLPTHAQELLSNISAMEAAVSKLEEEMVALHFQLIQERNERRLVEYRANAKQRPLPLSLPPPRRQTRPRIRRTPARLLPLPPLLTATFSASDTATDTSNPSRAEKAAPPKLHRQFSVKALGGGANPNHLSEDIVRCMRNIFISLSDSCREASRAANPSAAGEGQRAGPSPSGIAAFWSLSEPSSISSWVQSPQVDLNQNNNLLASETVFDPYKAREKLSWADIGGYGAASEVSWMSAGKKQLEYAAESLRKFR
uniref:Ternary complex factor MIP1 leucine-zipper domain-containing protein n=1 Tax=Aegilops tauschii TaxID=37682 RepID=N1QQD7_AEGTA